MAGLFAFVVMMGIKVWQIYNFDLIKAIYNKEHSKSVFNMSHWVVFNLLFSCLIFGHFYLFNFIFNGKTEPCVGYSYFYASTWTLLNDRAQVLINLIIVRNGLYYFGGTPISHRDSTMLHDRIHA